MCFGGRENNGGRGGRIEFGNRCSLMLNIDLTTLPITRCRAYRAQPYYGVGPGSGEAHQTISVEYIRSLDYGGTPHSEWKITIGHSYTFYLVVNNGKRTMNFQQQQLYLIVMMMSVMMTVLMTMMILVNDDNDKSDDDDDEHDDEDGDECDDYNNKQC